jgi:hypothetical protein
MQRFLSEGRIPPNRTAVDQFLKQFQAATDRERLAVAMQVRSLAPDQLTDFCATVLSMAEDESLLSMVFLEPEVVDKITVESLRRCLLVLVRLHIHGQIKPEFFQQCGASLVTHCNPALGFNFLGELHTVISGFKPSADFFIRVPGTSFDQAVAANFEEILRGFLTYDQFAHYASTLTLFDLPHSLEVLLKNRMAKGEEETLNRAVILLFSKNKLSDGYIDVCRRVLGDERFLAICKASLEENLSAWLNGIGCARSVAKLSAVYGEDSFHSPEFFESMFVADGEGHVPGYIRQFNVIGFDTVELPLLKAFITSNLERLIFFKPSYTNELELTVRLCGLAHQAGAGESALRVLLQRMGDLIGGEAYDDPPSVLIEGLVDAQPMTERSRGQYLLLNVVEKVGLKTLQAVVPDVGIGFLTEFIDKKKPAMNEVEIIRLFPQMKATLLEHSLGL